jgi:hypothetical protein
MKITIYGWSTSGAKVAPPAADGQQPGSVTTGEPARKPWRIMTVDSTIDGH